MRKTLTLSLFVLLNALAILTFGQETEPSHELEITAVEYSPVGNSIITGGKDLKIRLWNASNGKMIYVKDVEFIPLKFFISPNEKYLIVSQNAGRNVLYSFKSGEKLKDLMIEEVAGFTADSKSIVTISKADDGREKYVALGFADLNDESFINYFSYSRIYTKKPLKMPVETKGGKKLLLADHTSKIYLFKKDSIDAEERIRIDRPASLLALLRGDTTFIINGSSKFYNIKDGKSYDYLQEPTLASENTILFRKGNKIINYSLTELKIYDARSGKIIFKESLPQAKLSSVDPKGYGVAYTEDKVILKLKNLTSKKDVHSFAATDIIEKIAYQNYQKGIYFLNKGKYLKAKNHLTLAEKKSSQTRKLYYLLGDCYLQMGNYETGIRYLLMDHAQNPGRAAYKLAQGFAGLSDAETSIKWLDTAARAGISVNAFELQKDSFFTRLKSDPLFIQTLNSLSEREAEQYLRLGEERLKNKENLAALEFLTKAIVSDKANANLYRERAKLHLKLKEYEKARVDYLKEAELDTFNKAESFFNVALAYSKEGDMSNTIAWIRKGIQTDSTYLTSLVDIAELYESIYRRDLALTVLNDYLKFVPIDHYAIYLRASLMPMPETAKTEIKKAIELAKEEGDPVPQQYTQLLNSLETTASK